MHSYDDAPTPLVVPVRALLLTLLASVGVSWWLVPSKQEMLERVMMDRQHKEVGDLLRAQLASATGFADLDLSDLTASQLNLLAALLRMTPREQLQTIFQSKRQLQYDRYLHAVALAAVRYVDVIHPQQAWDIVGKQSERLTGEQTLDFATLLAHNALALSDPKLAATILEQAAKHPVSGPGVALELAQACRWSGRPLIGAQRLQGWLNTHEAKASYEEYKQLAELASTLALEGGQPQLALEILLAELQHYPDHLVSEEQMEHVINYATQAGQPTRARPAILRFVNQLPAAQLSWQDLRKQALSKPGELQSYRKYVQLLAQYSDWSSAFSDAYDHHYRLAACGSLESLDRCLALSSYLGRDEDMAGLLQGIGSVPERPELPIRLASMLAALGDDVGAKPLYESWLKTHPEDEKAHYEHACLIEGMALEEQAVAAFAEHVQRFPKDVRGVKKLAECYIRDHELQKALDLYAQLPAEAHDYMTRENYALLGESLDEPDHLLRAQILTVQAETKPRPELYLEMAETAMYLKDYAPALAAVEEGLELMPDSAGIRSALAQLYLRSDSGVDGDRSVERAAQVLRHPCVMQSPEAVSDLLAISYRITEKNEVLEFLGKDVESKLKLGLEDKLNLAVLCHLCEQEERGKALAASVPNVKANLPALAEMNFLIGHYQGAVDMMTNYLEDNPQAVSDDWVFLGDIYDEMGFPAEAQVAYEYSLQMLTSDLTGSTPSRRVSTILHTKLSPSASRTSALELP
jgi:tetratricopeptide (TPR) repeat protein